MKYQVFQKQDGWESYKWNKKKVGLLLKVLTCIYFGKKKIYSSWDLLFWPEIMVNCRKKRKTFCGCVWIHVCQNPKVVYIFGFFKPQMGIKNLKMYTTFGFFLTYRLPIHLYTLKKNSNWEQKNQGPSGKYTSDNFPICHEKFEFVKRGVCIKLSGNKVCTSVDTHKINKIWEKKVEKYIRYLYIKKRF